MATDRPDLDLLSAPRSALVGEPPEPLVNQPSGNCEYAPRPGFARSTAYMLTLRECDRGFHSEPRRVRDLSRIEAALFQ